MTTHGEVGTELFTPKDESFTNLEIDGGLGSGYENGNEGGLTELPPKIKVGDASTDPITAIKAVVPNIIRPHEDDIPSL